MAVARVASRGVTKVAAPVAELDVAGDGRRELAVTAIDQVEERVGGGRLVVALLHLAEPDVVDDEQLGSDPGPEATLVGVVGEGSVQVVEQVDAAGVADGYALLAGA